MIKYLKVSFRPVYWDDSSVNGEFDISEEEQLNGKEPMMPLHEINEGEGDGEFYTMEFTIELTDGRILNWPEDTYATMFYRVKNGHYALLDENRAVIYERDGDVPKLMDTTGESLGEYIELSDIDHSGKIRYWHNSERLKLLINNFMDY